jgi:hypothetical protein
MSGKITLKTIFKMAKDGGWDGSYNIKNDLAFKLLKEEKKRELKHFDDRHAVVMIEGKAAIVYREKDAAINVMTTRISYLGSVKTLYCNKFLPLPVEDEDSKRYVTQKPIFDFWMKWSGRNDFKQMVFKPMSGMIAGSTDLPNNESILNLYQGLAFEPTPGNCDLILDHIREVWCIGNEALFKYVYNWLARMFQKPGERGHTALVLHSGEGTGKNIIIDILVAAFGEHAFVASKSNDLVGRFNDHLGKAVLVFANEAVWGGDKQQEGALKQLVTDEKMAVERKYIPTYHTKNCVHLIIASNNDWVAPMGMDDRRFVVLDVSEQKKGDGEYFQRLADQIENGGDRAFIHYLLNFNINGFNPRVLPAVNSQAKYINKVKTADSVTQWLLDCLERGSLGTTPEDDWEYGIQVSKDAAHQAYLDWCKRMGINCRETMTGMTKTLKKLVGVRQTQPRSNGRRERIYEFLPLADCRQQIERFMGHGIDWGE